MKIQLPTLQTKLADEEMLCQHKHYGKIHKAVRSCSGTCMCLPFGSEACGVIAKGEITSGASLDTC